MLKSGAVSWLVAGSLIGEVEHLHAENREVSGNEDEHVAGLSDHLGITITLLLRWPQSHNFVRRHERSLNVIHARVDMRHYG